MKTTSDSEYGKVLRYNVSRALLELGWQHSDLYARAKITRSAYARLFKAPNGPRLTTVKLLAGVLQVHWTDLLRAPRPKRGSAEDGGMKE